MAPSGGLHFSPPSSPYSPALSTETAAVRGLEKPRMGLRKEKNGTKR